MKNFVFFLMGFLLFSGISSFSQRILPKYISHDYPLSSFIQDSMDHAKMKTLNCKWGISMVLIKVNKFGEVKSIYISDSVPETLRKELSNVVWKTSGIWDKGYLKSMGNNKKSILAIPVLNALVSECNDEYGIEVEQVGIDSTMERELSLWRSVSKTAIHNLLGISTGFKSLLKINSNQKSYLKCILLEPCIISDKVPQNKYRQL